MHFALPPRKSSFPPPYARVSTRSITDLRRKRLLLIAYVSFGVFAIYALFRWIGTVQIDKSDGNISPEASVLIVTVTDEKTMSESHRRMLAANRNAYATQHGYQTFYTDASAYTHLTNPSPTSWALIPALRNALTMHPNVDYIWSLSPHALIMNTSISLHDHIFSRLSKLMLKDIPVVPPDSVIHTFSHLTSNQAFLIISQDIDNLAHTSFLLKNTAKTQIPRGRTKDSWAQYFLDAWFDPLYRSYAFQKAENHALEHLVQWHPTVLAKFVVVDQRLLNSYNRQAPTMIDANHKETQRHDSMWQEGDLVVNFKGCKEQENRDCEKEMREYYIRWQNIEEAEGRRPELVLPLSDHPPRPLPVVQKDAPKPTGQPQQQQQQKEKKES